MDVEFDDTDGALRDPEERRRERRAALGDDAPADDEEAADSVAALLGRRRPEQSTPEALARDLVFSRAECERMMRQRNEAQAVAHDATKQRDATKAEYSRLEEDHAAVLEGLEATERELADAKREAGPSYASSYTEATLLPLGRSDIIGAAFLVSVAMLIGWSPLVGVAAFAVCAWIGHLRAAGLAARESSEE